MIPGAFDYLAPKSVEETVALLAQHGDDAKVLAGGQSLIPAMRFRLASPALLIDINNLTELEYVREQNGHLAIGALAREVMLEDSAVVARAFPLLADAARVIADPLARSPGGARVIPIDDFFVGLFETSLRPGELLTEIQIPRPAANSGGAYLKNERKVGDYAVSAVAVQLTMNGSVVSAARIGLTNVNSVPMRALNAEQALIGQTLSHEVLEAVGRAAAAECDPSADLRGSVEYKRDLTRVLTKRAIRKAVERAALTG